MHKDGGESDGVVRIDLLELNSALSKKEVLVSRISTALVIYARATNARLMMEKATTTSR